MSVISIPIMTLEDLIKIKDKNLKEFEKKARHLAHSTMEQQYVDLYKVFRIAKELNDMFFDVDDIENLIIQSENPYYIYRFAREIKNANIDKLEKAIINTGQLNYIAKFGCFIKGANTDLIEDIIINANNAKAAYIYIKFGKYPNINKLKHIFIKSKKPRYLYALAQFITNQSDIEIIQDLIIASRSNMYVRLFAANVPGSDLTKLENRILQTKNIEEINKFVKATGSERLKKIIMLV